MPAAYANSDVVDRYLKDELEYGRLVPVHPPLASDIHLSKQGVIPKKRQPGKWRLIVDLSSPKGASVNDFIDLSFCSLTYASVKDAAAYVFKAGQGALLAKLDIKSAYRNVPVYPGDRHLLGVHWQGKTFVDTCLPFGLHSAPKMFNAIADALEWIIVNQGGEIVDFVIHYLDDFLFGGCPKSDGRTLNLALQLCREVVSRHEASREVGFPVMSEKVVGLATEIDFLGFVIDTQAMEIRLPREKLSCIKHLIRSWRGKRCCSKRELLSLIGDLQHASTVVKPGRTFLRRMIDLSKRQVHFRRPSKIKHRVPGRSRMVGNVSCFWNGVAIISVLRRHPIDAKLVSDVSGSWGCGAYLGDKWFSLPWSSCPAWSEVHKNCSPS